MTRAELMRHALPQALTQSRWEILMAALWDFKLLRPFDFVVHDLACFLERLRRRRQWRRAGKPEALLVVNCDDESGVPSENPIRSGFA